MPASTGAGEVFSGINEKRRYLSRERRSSLVGICLSEVACEW